MTETNRPTPEEATRLLQENDQHRQHVAETAYPTWLWLLLFACIAGYGVVRDVWESSSSWAVWLFVVPVALTLIANNRGIGSRLGFRMAVNSAERRRSTRENIMMATICVLVGLGVVVQLLLEGSTAADHTIGWGGAAVLAAGAWALLGRRRSGARLG